MTTQHQLDYQPNSQHIQVLVDGVTVADTNSSILLYETGHPPRYYIPHADIDMQFLTAVDKQTHCPYKGDASYYNVVVNNETYAGIAWTYPNPIPDAAQLQGTIAFWPDKDERIQVLVDK
ncbi:MAG: DUF427 domain-containing protein [Chloroflexota bacterium]